MAGPGAEAGRGTSLPAVTTLIGSPGLGVVGNAARGPAFVPVSVGDLASYVSKFGPVKGDSFGSLAAQAWLSNTDGCTYIRLLGVGDGKKRVTADTTNSDEEAIPAGAVRNSGFVVGSRLTGSNGFLGSNPFAVDGGLPGRTYFLGTFMSDSAGSTYLSDAGLQKAEAGVKTKSAPILRGVLFAASGVLPALSGCYTGNASTSSAPVIGSAGTGATVGSFTAGQDGGSTVGSVNLSAAEDEFVLLLNGHISTDDFPNVITASFNRTSTTESGATKFFADVLNSDPEKIREAGHYLYTFFDIPKSRAVITGSGIVTAGTAKIDAAGNTLEECAFLLTSSIPRNATDAFGSLAVPNFENFCDRFTTAESPWVITQYINRRQYNLFKFHARDDGAFGNNQIKITIDNIKPQENDDEYGQFDVTVRSLKNVDGQISPLSGSEKFVGCTLDPSSDFYIAKVIGDRHFYFNFERTIDRQKYVQTGDYLNRSAMVRVEMSDNVEDELLPKEILPVGFRGPKHLIISGSSIMSNPQHPLSDGSVIASSTEWGNNLVEPPIPYREIISKDETSGLSRGEQQLQSEMCWGVQTTNYHTVKMPNVDLNFNESIKSYMKYFPDFTTSRQKSFVGNNAGIPDSSGTVYDSDRYNNNKFSLENILVHTRSDADIIDATQWAYSRYSRNRTTRPLLDSTLKERTGVRFFDVKKDLNDQTKEYAKFTFFLQGGFDGNNLFSREKQRFSNLAAYYEMTDPQQGAKAGATCGAYFAALRMMQEESEADIKLLAIPGIRIESITNQALSVAEERFDAFYIMDIQQIASGTGEIVTRDEEVSPSLTAENFKSRALNSSFAGVYFPDVSMVDPYDGINTIFAPPSISAVRVYGRLDSEQNIFAPAGTARGKIAGADGTAIETKVKFNATQKETIKKLYDASINPIITSDDGLILFGQRTLLSNADSMLQRISVRRMILEIRRQCRIAAKSILFEQNKEKTLKAYEEMLYPILIQMAVAGGVKRYKVKVDTTTTTQADIEANVVRGKVFIQPTKSDEIIQVDFST